LILKKLHFRLVVKITGIITLASDGRITRIITIAMDGRITRIVLPCEDTIITGIIAFLNDSWVTDVRILVIIGISSILGGLVLNRTRINLTSGLVDFGTRIDIFPVIVRTDIGEDSVFVRSRVSDDHCISDVDTPSFNGTGGGISYEVLDCDRRS
jgi:hypothetical protein